MVDYIILILYRVSRKDLLTDMSPEITEMLYFCFFVYQTQRDEDYKYFIF